MLSGMLCCWFSPSERRKHRNKGTPKRLLPRAPLSSPPAIDLSNACNQLQSPLFSRMPAELRCLIFGYAVGQQHDDDVIHLDLVDHDRILKHIGRFERGNMDRYKCCGRSEWEKGVVHIADREPGPLSLLLTCRLIYVEAVNLFYSHNIFDFRRILALEQLPRVLLPNRLSHIRSIQIGTVLTCPPKLIDPPPHAGAFISGSHSIDDRARWPNACRFLQSLSLSRLSIKMAIWGFCPRCYHISGDGECILDLLEPLKAIKVKEFNVAITVDLPDDLIARLGSIPFQISRSYCTYIANIPYP